MEICVNMAPSHWCVVEWALLGENSAEIPSQSGVVYAAWQHGRYARFSNDEILYHCDIFTTLVIC